MCTINDIETARILPPLFKGMAGDTIDGALPHHPTEIGATHRQ